VISWLIRLSIPFEHLDGNVGGVRARQAGWGLANGGADAATRTRACRSRPPSRSCFAFARRSLPRTPIGLRLGSAIYLTQLRDPDVPRNHAGWPVQDAQQHHTHRNAQRWYFAVSCVLTIAHVCSQRRAGQPDGCLSDSREIDIAIPAVLRCSAGTASRSTLAQAAILRTHGRLKRRRGVKAFMSRTDPRRFVNSAPEIPSSTKTRSSGLPPNPSGRYPSRTVVDVHDSSPCQPCQTPSAQNRLDKVLSADRLAGIELAPYLDHLGG